MQKAPGRLCWKQGRCGQITVHRTQSRAGRASLGLSERAPDREHVFRTQGQTLDGRESVSYEEN